MGRFGDWAGSNGRFLKAQGPESEQGARGHSLGKGERHQLLLGPCLTVHMSQPLWAKLSVDRPLTQSNKDFKPWMLRSITRFLFKKKPVGRKYTELFFLKKNSTFPQTFGKGVTACFSALWGPPVLTPDVPEILTFDRKALS